MNFIDDRSNITRMDTQPTQKPRRGRPSKSPEQLQAMRTALIRSGMEMLTERGYSATGLDAILKPAGVPKGSFYYYFDSKDAFVAEVIDAYAAFFASLLEKYLSDTRQPPIKRIIKFVEAAAAGMGRYQFRRGCLLGNLGQEISTLPEPFRFQIEAIFADWEARLAQCLNEAQKLGQIAAKPAPEKLAYLFWIGWEGAVLRAKLERTDRPLKLFAEEFMTSYQLNT